MEKARWHAGPLRLEPWIGIREAAYVDPGEGPGDYTVNAGLGLRAYLPAGSRAIVAAHVLPEYIWWRDHKDARRWGGREGVGVFVFGGRTAISVTATSSDITGITTSELDQRADVKDRRYEGSAYVPLTARFDLILRAGRAETTAKNPGLGGGIDFSTLDHTESWQDAGLRWWPSGHLALGAGGGRSQADFDHATSDRSNDGTSWFAEAEWRRAHTGASVLYRREQRDPKNGSLFVPFDGDTYSARLSWEPRGRLTFSVYGLSQLTYSLFADSSYFIDKRVGGEIGLAIGRAASLRGFYEDGTHDYVDITPDEDVTSVGGGLDISLWRSLRLSVVGRRTHTTSTIIDRTYSQIGFQVAYSGSTNGGAWY